MLPPGCARSEGSAAAAAGCAARPAGSALTVRVAAPRHGRAGGTGGGTAHVGLQVLAVAMRLRADAMPVQHLGARPLGPLLDHGRVTDEELVHQCEGRSNAAIAERLSVSLGTVEKRIASVFSKLELPDEADVNRRVAAVLVYLRERLPGRCSTCQGCC